MLLMKSGVGGPCVFDWTVEPVSNSGGATCGVRVSTFEIIISNEHIECRDFVHQQINLNRKHNSASSRVSKPHEIPIV